MNLFSEELNTAVSEEQNQSPNVLDMLRCGGC